MNWVREWLKDSMQPAIAAQNALVDAKLAIEQAAKAINEANLGLTATAAERYSTSRKCPTFMVQIQLKDCANYPNPAHFEIDGIDLAARHLDSLLTSGSQLLLNSGKNEQGQFTLQSSAVSEKMVAQGIRETTEGYRTLAANASAPTNAKAIKDSVTRLKKEIEEPPQRKARVTLHAAPILLTGLGGSNGRPRPGPGVYRRPC